MKNMGKISSNQNLLNEKISVGTRVVNGLGEVGTVEEINVSDKILACYPNGLYKVSFDVKNGLKTGTDGWFCLEKLLTLNQYSNLCITNIKEYYEKKKLSKALFWLDKLTSLYTPSLNVNEEEQQHQLNSFISQIDTEIVDAIKEYENKLPSIIKKLCKRVSM